MGTSSENAVAAKLGLAAGLVQMATTGARLLRRRRCHRRRPSSLTPVYSASFAHPQRGRLSGARRIMCLQEASSVRLGHFFMGVMFAILKHVYHMSCFLYEKRELTPGVPKNKPQAPQGSS